MSIKQLTKKEQVSFLLIAKYIAKLDKNNFIKCQEAIEKYCSYLEIDSFDIDKLSIKDELKSMHREIALVELMAFIRLYHLDEQINLTSIFIEHLKMENYIDKQKRYFWIKSPYLSEIMQKEIELHEGSNLLIRADLACNPSLSEELKIKLSKDKNISVRASLASNISLSEKLQFALSNDPQEVVQESLAANRSISKKIQLKLATVSKDSVHIALITNANTCEEIRHRLVENTKDNVRLALSANLNITEATHLQLAACNNTQIRCYLAAHPRCSEKVQSLFLSDSEQIRFYLANNPNLTTDIQNKLLEDTPKIRQTLASNKGISKAAQLRLAEDEIEVRISLAKNPFLNKKVQLKLSKDDFKVRIALSENPNLNLDIVSKLVNTQDLVFCMHLAENPNTIEPIQLELLNKGLYFCCLLASNPKTCQSIKLKLLSNELSNHEVKNTWLVRHFLADSKEMSPYVQKQLEKDKDLYVRCSLIKNPHIKKLTMPDAERECVLNAFYILQGNHKLKDKLLSDSDHWPDCDFFMGSDSNIKEEINQTSDNDYCGKLAIHSDFSSEIEFGFSDNQLEVSELLVSNSPIDKATQIRLLKQEGMDFLLAQNESLHKDLQLKIANNPCSFLRSVLAANPSLDRELQVRLAKDGLEVRQSLATNSSLDKELQLQLASDKNIKVRCCLAENPDLSTLAQIQLSRDALSVRKALAKNIYIDQQVKATLASDTNTNVRCNLANSEKLRYCLFYKELGIATNKAAELERHSLSESLQLQFATDKPKVRQALAENPSIKRKTQRMLAHDKNINVRCELARNSFIDECTQINLVHNQLRVRQALACNKSLTEEVKQKLLKDDEVPVLIEFLENQDIEQKAQQGLAKKIIKKLGNKTMES